MGAPVGCRRCPTVAVVTDTTHYLPRELVAATGVHQVSLYVNWRRRQEREVDMPDFNAFYDAAAHRRRSCRPPRSRRSATSSRSTSRCSSRAATSSLGVGIAEQDSLLLVVPMFHANAWGYPYLAAMVGTKLVFPVLHLDPESLLDDFVEEAVTWTAGVPTIWLGILQLLDANPGRWDPSRMKGMLLVGSAAPRRRSSG